MDQLTLRGFDDELEERIREVAESFSISLNKAALMLLREGSGLAGGTGLVGKSLDHLIGTWTGDDEREFSEAISDCAEVDEDLWR